MKKILGEKLRTLREAKGLRIRELASVSGVPESVISRLERGLIFPRQRTLESLSNALGIDIYSLFEEIGREIGVDPALLIRGRGLPTSGEIYPPLPNKMRLLKVIAEVPCGKPYEAMEDLLGYILIYEDEYPGATFSLRAIGDSMAPQIMQGDFIIVRLQDDVESGSIAVVSLETESGFETTIKRVVKQDNQVRLESLNPAYPPIIVHPGERKLRIIGKVIGLKRYFK
ncbi:helix-turn-helix domain-containing protein [bacterium]|nr:helix-turn-helix domain-containing protein [bacterium]